MKDNDSVRRLKSVELRPSSPLKTAVWRIRRGVRDILGGRDVLDVQSSGKSSGLAVHAIYKKADDFVKRYLPGMVKTTKKDVALKRLSDAIHELDYKIVDKDETKPWGAYYRFDSVQADRFITEFFPGLSPHAARLGRDDLELSPKLLLVAPGQRLSWQYHFNRAERWRFLSQGAYYRSDNDEMGEKITMQPGDVVQFKEKERHRLCTFDDKGWTLVAEIWQHIHPDTPSTEEDIVRVADDYNR